MTLTRLVAICVLSVALASVSVMWALFGAMWIRGETSLLIEANYFGEFLPEFGVLTLSMVFLPILLYELDQLANNE
jgi:ABC-type transporter Mla maintaining outer membrane lipid asymmetry permease subunit MlaE